MSRTYIHSVHGSNWGDFPFISVSLALIFTLSLSRGMMTSSNGHIFRVTGHLCGEFTGHRWIARTKASDAELCYFRWYASWIKGWVHNRDAGDLRCHRAHYGVIIMGDWSFTHHYVGSNGNDQRKWSLARQFEFRISANMMMQFSEKSLQWLNVWSDADFMRYVSMFVFNGNHEIFEYKQGIIFSWICQ